MRKKGKDKVNDRKKSRSFAVSGIRLEKGRNRKKILDGEREVIASRICSRTRKGGKGKVRGSSLDNDYFPCQGADRRREFGECKGRHETKGQSKIKSKTRGCTAKNLGDCSW